MSRRGIRLLLAVYLLVVLRITQWPDLADPSAFRWLERTLAWWHERGLPTAVDVAVVEAVANVVMFAPFGVLVPLALRWRAGATVLAGALFSVLIELSQLAFFPTRFATVQDVVMNTAGAVVGVTLLHLTALVAGRRPDRLVDVTSDAGESDAEAHDAAKTDAAAGNASGSTVSSDSAVSSESTVSPDSPSPPNGTSRPRPMDLLGESRLAPVDIDLGRVFRVGIVLWAVAVVVTTALLLAGQVEARTVAICGTGLALGFVALAWERRRRQRTASES